jgi:hypothetical protein
MTDFKRIQNELTSWAGSEGIDMSWPQLNRLTRKVIEIRQEPPPPQKGDVQAFIRSIRE